MEFNDVERERLRKLEALRAAGIDPYPPRAQFIAERVMAADAHARARDQGSADESLRLRFNHPSSATNGSPLAAAIMGRVVGKRLMGKASFVHLEDGTGKIQIYARIGEDSLSKESFDLFKELDLGDFVEARGELFITKTNEPTLRVAAWNLLAKAISQLPIAKEEKQPDGSVVRYSAFSSPELRYRQRYADLAVNPEVREVCQWSRRRLKEGDSRPVKGLRALLVGHTPVLEVKVLGNVWHLDTGGWSRGHFSLLELRGLTLLSPRPGA